MDAIEQKIELVDIIESVRNSIRFDSIQSKRESARFGLPPRAVLLRQERMPNFLRQQPISRLRWVSRPPSSSSFSSSRLSLRWSALPAPTTVEETSETTKVAPTSRSLGGGCGLSPSTTDAAGTGWGTVAAPAGWGVGSCRRCYPGDPCRRPTLLGARTTRRSPPTSSAPGNPNCRRRRSINAAIALCNF